MCEQTSWEQVKTKGLGCHIYSYHGVRTGTLMLKPLNPAAGS
jgi:hypothetical protein